jgi:hypothetical protein
MSFGWDPMSLGVGGILIWFLYHVTTKVFPAFAAKMEALATQHSKDMSEQANVYRKDMREVVDLFDARLKRQQEICDVRSAAGCATCHNFNPKRTTDASG